MKKYMVMVCGKSGTGKTMTLRNLKNQAGVWYLNCEGDEELPFDNDFKHFKITDPDQVLKGLAMAEEKEHVHTIVLDSMTFFCNMFVNKRVLTSSNTMAEWGVYARWIEDFMVDKLAKCTKNVIIMAHTVDVVNPDQTMETKVELPGKQLNIRGFEAFFNMIIGTQKMTLDDLEDYSNDHLNIDEWEEQTGYKHVIQTFSSAKSTTDRLRGKYRMWKPSELYIDNDIQIVIDKMRPPKQLKAAS